MKKSTYDDEQKDASHSVLLDHNLFIVWKPEHNLGIPIIDEQHRGIVTIINSLNFGMQHHYIEDMLAPLVDMMYDYTRIHFRVEETLFEQIDFPHEEEHKKLHSALASKLGSIGNRSILSKDAHEFMDFLKEWWINHICAEDLIFRDYMNEKNETR